jgi:quaternary ammonium compound-resistance protein SugE
MGWNAGTTRYVMGVVMAWFYLILAGLLEIVWATAMKQSQGFTRILPTGIMVVGMIASFWLLAVAMRSLPLGTSYTVWVGIGAVGAFLAGIILFGEPVTASRLLAAGLIVAGIVTMKLAS